MFGRKQDVSDALGLPSSQPEAPELPAGYRLRRVGPAQWVAEPSRYRVRLWVTAIVACVVGGGLGIHGTRLYYHRKAQAPLVVVNGVVIRRDSVRHDLERLHGVRLVQRLVSDELVRQFATAKGAWPTEAEVERRFRVERDLPGFQEELVRAGLSEEDYRARLRVRLAHVNLVIKGVEATEADARSFYERNIDPRNPRALFRHPARAQIAVIASSTKEAATKARYELIRDEP